MKQNRKQPKATARNSRGPPASFPEQPPQQRQQRAHDQAGHNGKMERSEEHTSELQSLRHLVCRLLLEKTRKRRPFGRPLVESQLGTLEDLHVPICPTSNVPERRMRVETSSAATRADRKIFF